MNTRDFINELVPLDKEISEIDKEAIIEICESVIEDCKCLILQKQNEKVECALLDEINLLLKEIEWKIEPKYL